MSSESGPSASERIPTRYTIPDPTSVEEHGRTWQAYREGRYFFPNDGDEQDRLDVQHRLWHLLMKNELYWAPIGQPKNVLDLGTGTGIWAIHFARQHPQAKIIGTDLSMIQPSNKPDNCTFFRDDAEERWVFEEQFDYVHVRLMSTCFDHPKDVMQNIYNSIQPGGWVEYQDCTLEMVGAEPESEEYVQSSPLARFINMMKLGLWNAAGRDTTVPRKYKEWMMEIGFVDVVEKPLLAPTNSWPLDPEDKLVGQFSRLNVEKGLLGTTKMALAAGMTKEELPEFFDSVRWSLGDPQLRGYHVAFCVYGRKPDWPSRVPTAGASEPPVGDPAQ